MDETLVDITYSSDNLAYTSCTVSRASSGDIATGTTTNSASVDVPIVTTQSGVTLQLVEAKVTLVAYAYAGASESNPTLASSSSSASVSFKNSSDVVSFSDSVSAGSSQYSVSNPSKVAVCNCLSRPNLRGTTKITVYINTSASNKKYKSNPCTSNAYATNVIGSYLAV